MTWSFHSFRISSNIWCRSPARVCGWNVHSFLRRSLSIFALVVLLFGFVVDSWNGRGMVTPPQRFSKFPLFFNPQAFSWASFSSSAFLRAASFCSRNRDNPWTIIGCVSKFGFFPRAGWKVHSTNSFSSWSLRFRSNRSSFLRFSSSILLIRWPWF